MKYLILDDSGFANASVGSGFVLFHVSLTDNGIVIAVKRSDGTSCNVIDPRFNGIEEVINTIIGD